MTLTGCQERLWIESAEDLDQLGDNPGPAGLVAGARARAGVAVEVLVEENVVSPVGIGLERCGVAEDGTPTVLVAEEDTARRSGSSLLTSKRFIIRPDPVGHSTRKPSP